MRVDPNIKYITHPDAPHLRIRVNVLTNGMIFVTLQKEHRSRDTNYNYTSIWIDSYSYMQKFQNNEMFDAICYANDLIRKLITEHQP